MLLSIKEMEVKEVRFDETFPPGEIDFSGSEVTQTGPLHAVGVAELLHNTGGEVRIKGRPSVQLTPFSKATIFNGPKPWSWYIATTAS